jgi:HlyD family secretion protein
MSGSIAILPRPAGAIETRPRTRGIVLFGLAAIAVFFGSLAVWSLLAPLSEAAIAPGMIKVEGQRRTIQHLEGGIVREILVRDGDVVRRGQTLLRLDDVQSSSTLEMLRGQRSAYMAEDARLKAELARAGEVTFPAPLIDPEEPRAREAVAGQRALFEARRASLASQIQVQQARIGQQQAVIASAEGQFRATSLQLELIRREEQMTSALVAQGLQRLPHLLAMQRSAAALAGTGTDLSGQIERARASITEANSAIQQIEDARMQEASTAQRELRARITEADERLRAAEDVSARREITAPEDGTILGSRFFTLGAVIRAGDPVMELVPTQDRLVAEVNVQPHDIDVVHVGLRAEVRLPAFKQRLVPYLHGQVIFVANDVTIDPNNRTSYYRAQISIDREQLDGLQNVTLVAGMPVEAMIQIGARSFVRYMIQPILDSFHRSFREQ